MPAVVVMVMMPVAVTVSRADAERERLGMCRGGHDRQESAPCREFQRRHNVPAERNIGVMLLESAVRSCAAVFI